MAMVSRFHSSSSMATADQPSWGYDVFLSFRGEDTRKNFTDHLYTALKQAGIRTFRDDDAMERGKLLKPELQKAIHDSAISLIVFSKDYASSTWCLDEVMMIIEKHETSSSKHEVVPVFYKVDPSDVRHQIGSFKEAFDALDDEIKAEKNLQKKKELSEKVGRWRDSLKKAATFTGMVLADGYESQFIINIVNVVRKKMDYKTLYIEDQLVGIEDSVAQIESWLQDPSPDKVILLIAGMGGIGKSTIAKCIFNLNFLNYDGSCFLADINKEASNQSGGLRRLQSQLVSTILKSEKEETIWNEHEGTIKVTNVISNKKILLILDDVATLKQLDALLGPKRFYPGSKVIITTRHKELSTAFKVHPEVQSVEALSMDDSIELFSLYAFHQHKPIEPYIVQSEVFAHHCKGLPLALRVLGSSLRGKTTDEWEDTMRKLATIPDPEIQEVLQVSYEALKDDTDKELFLHIACFFEDEKEDYIVKLLAACGLYSVVGMRNLTDRCLLYVEYGRVKMHQLIKEMGREVVRKESPKDPGKRSRLWHHDDCFNVLQDHTGTKKVEGFMLDMEKIKEDKSTCSFQEYLGKTMSGNDANFKIGALEKMNNLMLLQLNYVTFSGKRKKVPKKLRLLRWHGFSLKAIPGDICLEKLVVLDMSHSKLKRVWEDFKFIGSLKILNLSHSVELVETPDFDGFPELESLILKGCSSLIKVHKSIAHLKELVLLDLTDCRSLRNLPCLPTCLVLLQISGCRDLKVLERVQSLGSILSLSLLKEANFSYCNLFDKSFTNDWSSLVSLVELQIDGNNITFLPKCIQTLPIIKHLSVKKCLKLQSILGLPQSLQTLHIMDNESLEEVHPAHNSKVHVLWGYCPKLREVDGRFKIRPIDKVEKKIIRYLGLESNAGEGMELGLQVFHEFGIFSTFVLEKHIPSSFMCKESGGEISFKVPFHHDHSSRITGFSLCAMFSPTSRDMFVCRTKVYNMTKDVWWEYTHLDEDIQYENVKFGWSSVWRCGSLLEGGDEVHIHVIGESIMGSNEGVVEECGINLLCEDGEELDGETQEAHHVNVFDQISWTDRLLVQISDYVHNGKTYMFTNVDRLRDHPMSLDDRNRFRWD